MTLTELNYYVRKFAPLAVIFLLVIIILFFSFQLLFLYASSKSPTVVKEEAVALNPIFNKIKTPILPKSRQPKLYTYVLDTIDGTSNIEEATSAANVYFIPKPSATFGFLSQIYLMAETMGIDTKTTQHVLRDTTAEFDDGKRKLQINIDNYNFNFDFVFTPDDINFETSAIPSTDKLESDATGILSRINRYPPELAQGKKNIIYLNFNPESKALTSLQSSDGSNMAEVDFYRPDIDGYPMVTSTYYNSPNYVLFAFDQQSLKVVRAQITLLEHSIDQVGVYPIKTSSQAWEEFNAGSGFVASATTDGGEVKIKKIFLAYFDPDVYQEYLQPVYVFLGENNFVGYVPAVKSEFVLPQ
jgi:hypothetical protein